MKPARSKPQSTAPTPKPPSRLARMLALAHHVDRLIEDGQLKSHADAARLLGASRSRMAQIVGLLALSAEIQSGILTGEIEVGERAARGLAREAVWGKQE